MVTETLDGLMMAYFYVQQADESLFIVRHAERQAGSRQRDKQLSM